MELPKLTDKQQKFVLNYVINGNKASEAYRAAYDCSKMANNSIAVEANKMLNHPNVTLWLKRANANVQQVFEDKIKYSAKDCFDELAELQGRCRKSSKTYSVEKSCIELKGKLAGHFVDKHQVTGGGLAEVLDQLK